jgi:hypothetical protein
MRIKAVLLQAAVMEGLPHQEAPPASLHTQGVLSKEGNSSLVARNLVVAT